MAASFKHRELLIKERRS